jgi:hypothetical protein
MLAHVLAYSYFPDTIASARRNGHQGLPPAKDNEIPQVNQISAPPVKEKPPDEEIFYNSDYIPPPERGASTEESVRIYEEGCEPEPSDLEYPKFHSLSSWVTMSRLRGQGTSQQCLLPMSES